MNNSHRKLFLLLLFCLGIALSLTVGHLHAQEPKVIYIYDDLGRLARVVNQNNECATYEYDAVGNILSITRSTNCLQPPTIAGLSQHTATTGETTCITITGTNFFGATVTTDNPDVQVSRVRVTETSIEVCFVVSPFASAGTARIFITTPAGVVESTLTINPKLAVISQSTTIGRLDQSFEGVALTIEGPVTVTIEGPHRFSSLTLRNGAHITHPATTSNTAFKLELTVDTVLEIDATSRIDVSGRGFLGGGHPGNPFNGNPFFSRGMTVGFQAGSTAMNGGSYGGLGGESGGGVSNPVYGEFKNPNDPGSGGASFAGSAGSGGGLIRIVAGTVQLNGMIKADGEPRECCYGAGSGGGIRIDVTTLQGTGQITANGGNGQRDNGGGGGGGRIAVYYQNLAGFDLARATAFGGVGFNGLNGGAGTIYLQGPGRENGELIVDNNNLASATSSTPILPTGTGVLSLSSLRTKHQARVRVDDQINLSNVLEVSLGGELALAKPVVAATLDMLNGGIVTHLPTTGTTSFKIDISAGAIHIDSSSRIDVTGRGFLGGGRPGNPFLGNQFFHNGMTVGFQRGATGQSGGGYGGLGGAAADGSSNPVYGDFRDPNDPGSGGAAFAGSAGNGGGLIRIVAETIQLDGMIKGDGEVFDCCYGGGSGGGIRIDVGILSGNGQITANGGNGQRDNGAGGGGGRIAVYYQDAAGFDFIHVTAFGGLGNGSGPNGGAGTVYLQGLGRENGELVIDNNSRSAASLSSPIPAGASGIISLTHLRVLRSARVQVDSTLTLSGTLEIALSGEFISTNRTIAGTIDLNNSGIITHLPTTAMEFFKVDLSADNFALDATGRIDVTTRGYLGSGQPGNPFVTNGMSVGFQAGSAGNSGGSYGGLGAGGSPNPVYGSAGDPADVGSGGGRSVNDPAGNGGGLVRIMANTLRLDGVILANGGDSTFSGGGSGGGVRIDTGTFQGSGKIAANGGRGLQDGRGGGGGRIAIYYQDATGFDFARVTASGGSGAANGQNGTVHLEQQTFTGGP